MIRVDAVSATRDFPISSQMGKYEIREEANIPRLPPSLLDNASRTHENEAQTSLKQEGPGRLSSRWRSNEGT